MAFFYLHIYLNFPVSLSVIMQRIKSVTCSQIHFFNNATNVQFVLWVASWICIIIRYKSTVENVNNSISNWIIWENQRYTNVSNKESNLFGVLWGDM